MHSYLNIAEYKTGVIPQKKFLTYKLNLGKIEKKDIDQKKKVSVA